MRVSRRRRSAVHAIDTNVVVRYLVADHPEQSKKAKTVIEGGAVFVATTVLLETEWVLRSAYGFAADAISKALRRLAGLPQVTLENPLLAARALDLMDSGMDFADALHLSASDGCESFSTFDRRLVKVATAHKLPVKFL